ncbi:GLIP1 protein, partial [Piaya cayana]|nr:GLIP1 protein [Piaya cayana]
IMISRFSACVLALLYFCHSSDAYEISTLPDVGDPKFIEECVQTHDRFRSGVNPPASNMLYMEPCQVLDKYRHVRRHLQLCKHHVHIFLTTIPKVRGQREGEEHHCSVTPQLLVKAIGQQGQVFSIMLQRLKQSFCHQRTLLSLQVVWATSYKVGCAVHFCPKVAYSSITKAAHFICNYGP